MNKKLSKEEYNYAKGCLKRYNYNCINIMNIRADILSIGSQNLDGMPKAPYNISDNVLNSVIKLQEDEQLQKSIKEYKAVVQALELINKDCKIIFNKYYILSKTKWEVIESGMSERTFERRNQELIYAVHNELKKSWRKIGGILTKYVIKLVQVKKSQIEISNPMR